MPGNVNFIVKEGANGRPFLSVEFYETVSKPVYLDLQPTTTLEEAKELARLLRRQVTNVRYW